MLNENFSFRREKEFSQDPEWYISSVLYVLVNTLSKSVISAVTPSDYEQGKRYLIVCFSL